MKKLLVLLICCGCCPAVHGQINNELNVGGRLAYGGLVSAKYFYVDRKAAEALVSFRWSGIIFTGLLEWHRPVLESTHLTWYYGGGFHLGLHSANTEFVREYDYDPKTYVHPGIDGIIGLEYRFQSVPLNLSLDWKPAITFTVTRGFFPEEVGLAVRYRIGL